MRRPPHRDLARLGVQRRVKFCDRCVGVCLEVGVDRRLVLTPQPNSLPPRGRNPIVPSSRRRCSVDAPTPPHADRLGRPLGLLAPIAHRQHLVSTVDRVSHPWLLPSRLTRSPAQFTTHHPRALRVGKRCSSRGCEVPWRIGDYAGCGKSLESTVEVLGAFDLDGWRSHDGAEERVRFR